MSSATLTQTFNGVIFPIVATVLFVVVQYLVKRRCDNHDVAQHEAPWGEGWRGHLKLMALFSSIFGFLNVFSPMFNSSLLAMAIPMVGTSNAPHCYLFAAFALRRGARLFPASLCPASY